MKIEVKKIELDGSILEDLKIKIYNYFNRKPYTNTEQLNELLGRMDEKKKIFVENLVDQSVGRMVNRQGDPNIAIDEQFCQIDENGKVSFKSDKEEIIKAQLIHELMHSASRKDGLSGIRKKEVVREEIDKSNSVKEIETFFEKGKGFGIIKQKGLDEGITQMMAENIVGYTISPNIDSYKDLKKYAKILESTFEEKIMFNSYFFKTGELKNVCTELSKDNKFWENFNQILDNDFEMVRKSRDKNSTEHDRQIAKWISDTMQSHIIKYFTASIIIPKLKQCTKVEQEEYLQKIFYCVKDDEWFKESIFEQIKKLNSKDEQDLENEKNDAFSTIKGYTGLTKGYIKCLKSEKFANALIDVREDKVCLSPDREVNKKYIISKDTPLEEKLLAIKIHQLRKQKIYDDKKNLYPSLSENGLLEETKAELDDVEKRIIINNFNSKRITFKKEQNLMYRKMLLAEIKILLGYNGFEVLNKLSECENADSIDLVIKKVSRGETIKSEDIFEMIKKYAQANPGELSKKVNEVANQFNRNLNKNNTRQN